MCIKGCAEMSYEPMIGMRQVRYFLAAAEELNFTRAANKCKVSQPTLTRAILRLEGEMGGDLFHRERSLTHLTELGSQIRPLLEQVFKNAVKASQLARSIRSQTTARLHIGFPQHVPLGPIAPQLLALTHVFPEFDFRVTRGAQAELTEKLKAGDLDVMFGCAPSEEWDRFEFWKLFHCQFKLVFTRDHPFAQKMLINVDDLEGMSLLHRSYCPFSNSMLNNLTNCGVRLEPAPAFTCDEDLIAFLSTSKSVAYLPSKAHLNKELLQRDLNCPGQGFDFHAITVSGRRRGAALSRFLDDLRAADWQSFSAS